MPSGHDQEEDTTTMPSAHNQREDTATLMQSEYIQMEETTTMPLEHNCNDYVYIMCVCFLHQHDSTLGNFVATTMPQSFRQHIA